MAKSEKVKRVSESEPNLRHFEHLSQSFLSFRSSEIEESDRRNEMWQRRESEKSSQRLQVSWKGGEAGRGIAPRVLLFTLASFFLFAMTCWGAPYGGSSSSITITSPAGSQLPYAMSGRAYSFPFKATGTIGTFSWTNPSKNLGSGACAGLNLSTNGLLSGTPPGSSGTCTFTVEVRDMKGNSRVEAVSLNFVSPLSVASQVLGNGVQNRPFQQAISVTGGVMPLTSCRATPGLPAGLSISPSGSQCVISGSPSAVYGPASITISVTDSSNATASGSASLQINAPLAIVAPSRIINGLVGFAYPGVSFTASGGTGSALTWTQAGAVSATGLCTPGGSMPAGLTLAATSGTLTGVPSKASASPADFPFQVCVEDAPTASTPAGAVVSAPVVLNVLNRYAYLTTGGQQLQVLDLVSNTFVRSIPLAANSNPIGIALTPDGRYAFAADNSLDQLIVVDTITNQQVPGSPFPLPASCDSPWDLAISPDPARQGANRAFITCTGDQPPAREEVVVLDTANPGALPLAVIPTGVGSIPSSLAVRNDNSRVYVALNGTDQLYVIDNTGNTPAPTAAPVFELDPASEQPMGIVLAQHDGKLYAYVGKDDPDQSHAYEGIEVVDVTTDSLSMVTMISFPAGSINVPTNAAVDPSGSLVYFTLMDSGKLAVVDNTQSVPAFVPGSPFNLPNPAGPAHGYAYGLMVPPSPSGDYSVYVTLFCPQTLAVLSDGVPPSGDPGSPVSVPADYLIFNVAPIPVPK